MTKTRAIAGMLPRCARDPDRLLGLEVPRLARGAFYPRRAARSAAGSSTTRRCSTPSRSTAPSTGWPSPRRSRAGSSETPAGLRLRGQGEPVPDAHEAPARHRARASSASTTAIEPLAARPSSARCCGSCPSDFKRDEDRLADALDAAPARPPLLRVPPPSWFTDDVLEILRGHGVALAIGDHPERPWQPLELTADWTLRALPLRPPRPARQLLARPSCASGRARVARCAGRRGLRLLQQRLGGFAVRNAPRLRALLADGARASGHGRRRARDPDRHAHVGGRRLLARPGARLAPDRGAAAAPRLPRDPGQPASPTEILGERCYPTLARDPPEPVEVVDIFRRCSDRRARTSTRRSQIGAQAVWMQLGVIDDGRRRARPRGGPARRDGPLPGDRVAAAGLVIEEEIRCRD